MLRGAIARIVEGRDLSQREAARAMEAIMKGDASDAQIAAFAVALRMKGETAGEIAGCATAMRRRGVRLVPRARLRAQLVDTCGTGGDGLGTVNVSTMAAIVAAGAGIPVAKHGNRSVSSRCGSADLLEALGVSVDLDPAQALDCLDRTGMTFLYAPRFHPALQRAAAARHAIGLRTIFNLIGPLCNPARAPRQVIGVHAPGPMRVLADVLRDLGARRALLVHGSDGMDEITVTGPTAAVELRGEKIRALRIHPEKAGVKLWPAAALKGGGPARNAECAIKVLEGRPGALRDITILNAGAAIWIGGMAKSLRGGVRIAARAIDEGAAAAVLERLRDRTRARDRGTSGRAGR